LDILRDAVPSIVANLADSDAVGHVVHALWCNVTRHQVVHMFPDAATINAERFSHQDGLAKLPPSPTCVRARFDASSSLVVPNHIKVPRIADRVTEGVVH
jgi:hypothetical protein